MGVWVNQCTLPFSITQSTVLFIMITYWFPTSMSLYSYLCVSTTKYDFIKYENTNKNNTTYFNSTNSTNTTGQKANMLILGFQPDLFPAFHETNSSWQRNVMRPFSLVKSHNDAAVKRGSALFTSFTFCNIAISYSLRLNKIKRAILCDGSLTGSDNNWLIVD